MYLGMLNLHGTIQILPISTDFENDGPLKLHLPLVRKMSPFQFIYYSARLQIFLVAKGVPPLQKSVLKTYMKNVRGTRFQRTLCLAKTIFLCCFQKMVSERQQPSSPSGEPWGTCLLSKANRNHLTNCNQKHCFAVRNL